MPVLLVGHGPSVLRGLGAVIDTFTVVRCKAPLPKPEVSLTKDYGTRTDYIVCRAGGSHYALAQSLGVPVWQIPLEGNGLPQWEGYWKRYSPKLSKYSHGLAAAFLAMEHLKPDALHVIGYDRLLGRITTGKSWETEAQAAKYVHSTHDWAAEGRALQGLGVPIYELTNA